MRTAVDSSILLDILAANEFAHRSEVALLTAKSEGTLVVCDMVVAEISPALEIGETEKFLADIGIKFLPSSFEESLMAGNFLRHYLRQGGKAGRIVPDFIIAAHSIVNNARLLTRDRGFQKKEFSKLQVISP